MSSSTVLFERARAVMPGGVSASARRNAALGHPFYISRGDGATVFDLDGKPHIDMCLSHGASLLGHNHPAIRAAVTRALDLGTIAAAETEHQVRLAETLRAMVPCAEMSRFSGSGSETMMHALRLARAATGREKFIKFEGHFHGYADFLNYSWAPPLAAAGPADLPAPYPESAGIPRNTSEHVIVAPFNDPAALARAFKLYGHEIAALIMEPINYDSGCILPIPGFAQLCRDLCDAHGALLLFDEVLTAFRAAPGGAQQVLGVAPDLAVLGKAFGGGMPISALCGKSSVMRHMRPEGTAEMSGTYLSHLTATLAAQAALDVYASPGFYEHLDALGERFYGTLRGIIDRHGIPVRLQHAGPRFALYFGLDPDTPVSNYRQSAAQNQGQFLTFVRGCIARGVFVHVSAHHGFSAAHTDANLDRVVEAMDGALQDIKQAEA